MVTRTTQRVTISDVARVAGVSRGTVSRVLNGGKWVSKDASDAVLKAIKSTGYVASASARQLRTGRGHTVAFLVDDSPAAFFSDPNFEVIVSQVSDCLAARRMPMVLLLAGGGGQTERTLDFIRSGAVAGVVAASTHTSTLKALATTGVPFVNCGEPAAPAGRVAYVTADEHQGGRLVGQHLVDRGARRVVAIVGPEDSPGGTLRLAGFREAVGDRLVDGSVRHGDYTRSSGRALAADLLDGTDGVDAVWAASDVMAEGVLDELRARGLRVPEDILLAGFDDSEPAQRTHPPLTTVRQPFDVISRKLVAALVAGIDDGVRATVTVPVELVVRGSTGD
ncbi:MULTISPECIES: LacI family DNA-binding transcriptional regulator [unclassified Actinomyces]|nr:MULTISPECIES: LacI family DNA-binding transcriptional regulator [unclassified Actinomyces]MCL3777866.1 LacI family DNA-binding transcriptional regulator [Actinomyces sp. AC-20-1]